MISRREILVRGWAALLALPGVGVASMPATATSRRSKAEADPGAPPQVPPPPSPLRALLQQARSWSYQLQNYEPAALAASTADILVVDDSLGTGEGRKPSQQLRDLKRKPDGTRRIVLAYLSIGEAEEYRYYWKADWIETATPDQPDDAEQPPPAGAKAKGQPANGRAAHSSRSSSAEAASPPKSDRWPSRTAPPWLADENEAWSGNFAVRYEHPDWQAIFLDGPRSYLARIVEAGFDGVYLDRVDAFYDHNGDLDDPARAMVDFVRRIAETAHRLKPDFLIVPQNGEELLLRPGYVDLIDAIAKEDLLYGSPTDGKPNSAGQVVNSVGWLSIARRRGHPVLAVEYLDDTAEISKARLELTRLGYVATFAPRLLDALSPHAVPPLP